MKAAGIEAYLIKPVKQFRLFDCLVSVATKAALSTSVKSLPLPQKLVPFPVGKIARKIRVLLAEDNIINQKVLMSQLHKLGCIADVVANGLEAIKALRVVCSVDGCRRIFLVVGEIAQHVQSNPCVSWWPSLALCYPTRAKVQINPVFKKSLNVRKFIKIQYRVLDPIEMASHIRVRCGS